MSKFLNIAVSGVQNLAPYIPGKPIEELEREYNISNAVKLASNENPYGPSPQVINKLQEIVSSATEISLYPDGSGYRLKALIAERFNIVSEQITLGNGSNDILDIITRCFAGVGDEVIFSQYAFAVYPICTQAVGATAVITDAVDWGHDLDAMLKACNSKTKLIFIANPNNPTGTCLTTEQLYNFLSRLPNNIVVVIDEAYMEYAIHQDSPYKDTYTAAHLWLNEFDNLIVTRTFSKAYGLASLRIGYSISCNEIADLLNRVRQPFNNNTLALEAAMIALEDQDYINEVVEKNWQQMHYIEDELKKLNMNFISSAANFLCIDVSDMNESLDSMQIYDKLLHEGVITRPVANYKMPDHLRVTIGKDTENQRLIESFKCIL
ncbi:MAG: histidinol-phosphate transaminase [Pseudomonadota bacterium]